jgi:hypothetical protein
MAKLREDTMCLSMLAKMARRHDLDTLLQGERFGKNRE